MTPYSKIYDSFLSKILDDEWGNWTKEEVEAQLEKYLDGAISEFKFPRASLKKTEDGLEGDLSLEEIEILALYMKCEWLEASIYVWENIKPLYEERDFSQANMLAKLIDSLEYTSKRAEKKEAKYYRSRDKKPFNFKQLAGGGNG